MSAIASYELVPVDGGEALRLFAGATVVVGRGADADRVVADPTVSRRHARLEVTDAGVQIRDLGSSNGSFVKGRRIRDAEAAPGDAVAFGQVAFRLEAALELPAPPPPEPCTQDPPTTSTIVLSLPVDRVPGLPELAASRAAPDDPALPGGRELTRRKLALLVEVSKSLSGPGSVDEILDRIVGMVFQVMDVDRAALLLTDDDGELATRVARVRRCGDGAQVVPRSVARHVVDERVAVLTDDAQEDVRFGGASIVMQRVRSAMCAPLVVREGRVHGVLYMDNLHATERFQAADLEFLAAFSGIAAVAIENGRYAEQVRREELARANFERFFTPALAACIAGSSAGLELGGERRRVAILFSDIRGFTKLSESMSPEALADMLNEYFTAMVECVFRHGGTLDKFIGDGVLAQWGAPVSAEDDADRALAAAGDMLDALEDLNDRWRGGGRPELKVGVGVSVGEVFAGYIGSERRLEYTVLGDPVNVAYRLSSLASAGEILVTDTLMDALAVRPSVRAHGELPLRGKDHAVAVFTLDRSSLAPLGRS
jgi:adenylate cyclase